jgi:hypothetical protein
LVLVARNDLLLMKGIPQGLYAQLQSPMSCGARKDMRSLLPWKWTPPGSETSLLLPPLCRTREEGRLLLLLLNLLPQWSYANLLMPKLLALSLDPPLLLLRELVRSCVDLVRLDLLTLLRLLLPSELLVVLCLELTLLLLKGLFLGP